MPECPLDRIVAERLPVAAYPADDYIQLAKSLIDRLRHGDVNNRLLTYERDPLHGTILARTKVPGDDNVHDILLFVHQTDDAGLSLLPPIRTGKFVLLIASGTATETTREFIANFANGSGGFASSDGGTSWSSPNASTLMGLDRQKIEVLRRIGFEHAVGAEAMLRHKEIKIALPRTPIKYPPAPERCPSHQMLSKQCF